MSFTAEFLGGPLDGVRSLVTNPPLPERAFWGLRCLGGGCRLARELPEESQRAAARAECREQRCHLFTGDPAAFGLPAGTRYRRVGARENAHQYEVEEGALGPGQAAFAEPERAPA